MGPDPAVFVSFSYKDTQWKNRIVAVLRGRGIDVWEDSRLRTGDNWDAEIHQAIDRARVAILLITPAYLNSDTIQKEQVPYLLGRPQDLRLYPILVEPCEWGKFEWLARLQLFPSDLQPLASIQDAGLSARLTLAALEISSFAGIATVPQMVSAKLMQSDGRFAGMATLVHPDFALSVKVDTDPGTPCILEFPNLQTPTVQASVEYVHEFRSLSLLRLKGRIPWEMSMSLSIPDRGAEWECFTFPTASSPGVFTTGTVVGMATRNGRQYLHLEASIEQHEARGMSGAGIVVDGKVVAVLESQGAILDEWFAIPLQAMDESPIGPIVRGEQQPPTPPTPDEPEPEFDLDGFLARLTDGARAALARAEAYRQALGQSRLHMEHLLLGLYSRPDSPMRRLARDAKVFDEPAFRKLLSAGNAKLASNLALGADASVTNQTLLSKHVRRAFIAARKPGVATIGRRSLIDGAFSVTDCDIIILLRNAIRVEKEGPASQVNGGQKGWLPEVSSDVPGEKDKDLLNIQRDVGALCSVIAARDAALPLSIGLFGDWGSGKSFFMKEMEQQLEHLAKQGPPTYCSNIVQLKFNAWHYMDTTLWASLTSEIFEGLATKLSKSKGAEPENKAAELLADMSTSRDKLADAERKKRDADAQLAESERRLRELRNNDQEIRASLTARALLTEATRFAFEQDEVKTELNKAAKELNLPQAEAAGAEVHKELMELRGLWSALLLAMRNTERLWVWMVALGLVIGAVFGIPALLRFWFPSQLESVKPLVTAITTALGSFAALLAPFLVPAKRALKYLQDARKKSDDIVKSKQSEKQAELDRERKARQDEVERQNQNVDAARKRVVQLEQAIEGLRTDRQMLDFIQQRNVSTDYTSHLGVIARAHKDFRELSAFLVRVGKEPPQPNLPRVERIVLYIDDLDRCPENKVMDVLQAVHLLLAFPLFVVVVGVDPRWLLHSVAERSPALQRGAQELWHSTPLNYLEKIFQIPFTLSPMSSTGFGELVDKGAGLREGSPAEHKAQPLAVPAVAAVTPKVQSVAAGVEPSNPAVPQVEVKSERAREEPKAATPAPVNTPPAEPLKIEVWEREFMKQLYCLIPSPRAGKRFINIYRMIRSTIDGAKWEAFVGDATQGGHHRHALLLLAVLTGYPAEAAEILRQLIEREHNETWWEFLASFDSGEEGWPELRVKLHSLRALVPDTEGCDVFREYAPRVARYSFQSGRVLLAQRLPETDN